jgi:hypothetical protein
MIPRHVLFNDLVKQGMDPEQAFTQAYEGCREDTKQDARKLHGLPEAQPVEIWIRGRLLATTANNNPALEALQQLVKAAGYEPDMRQIDGKLTLCI